MSKDDVLKRELENHKKRLKIIQIEKYSREAAKNGFYAKIYILTSTIGLICSIYSIKNLRISELLKWDKSNVEYLILLMVTSFFTGAGVYESVNSIHKKNMYEDKIFNLREEIEMLEEEKMSK